MLKYFIQKGPSFSNPYENDPLMDAFLRRYLLGEQLVELKEFGQKIVDEVESKGMEAESCPPQHQPFDPWGSRIDQIKVSEAWEWLHQFSAKEGLVALGYERPLGKLSRLLQFAKLYLFHPSSAFYTCPLAMTDGAAKLIEVYGKDALTTEVFQHLTSRNGKEFWTSGQWMTEAIGGSDVGLSETTAVPQEDGSFLLYGKKWFVSATTSQVAMGLARIERDGKVAEGSRGLSVFLIPVHKGDQKWNGLEILRLKDKLGTKALPTAEVLLDGTKAYLLGDEGKGVKIISTLFNITRLYNACTSVATMRRLLQLSYSYAEKRKAFGRAIKDLALHKRLLNKLEAETQGAFHLVFFTALQLGKSEVDKDLHAEKLLRLLTPLAKLYTGRQCVSVVSELVESFGGAGYIEDTGIPRFLRDAQVFSIWEGTTHVLCLDVLRAIVKEQAFEAFYQEVRERLSNVKTQKERLFLEDILEGLKEQLSQLSDPQDLEGEMRFVSARMVFVLVGALMLEFAEQEPSFQLPAQEWLRKTPSTIYEH
ncbi:MAG: acyl-CoA dehydrogenase [Bdellovibrio sp.]|nr:MAG: acyl-CoA dehydrogenase [Bdellovibrio sp.]